MGQRTPLFSCPYPPRVVPAPRNRLFLSSFPFPLPQAQKNEKADMGGISAVVPLSGTPAFFAIAGFFFVLLEGGIYFLRQREEKSKIKEGKYQPVTHFLVARGSSERIANPHAETSYVGFLSCQRVPTRRSEANIAQKPGPPALRGQIIFIFFFLQKNRTFCPELGSGGFFICLLCVSFSLRTRSPSFLEKWEQVSEGNKS
jgi:hypothetical protein